MLHAFDVVKSMAVRVKFRVAFKHWTGAAQSCHGNGAGLLRLTSSKTPSLAVVFTAFSSNRITPLKQRGSSTSSTFLKKAAARDVGNTDPSMLMPCTVAVSVLIIISKTL
ncbi:uncharacterized protein LOC143754032 [Siphateles boraxobius]|uniref:uncharacterized protein LOC143754032 n=1 Tax=Siphateles boraxobius TaxID=180520 RepID=UPI004062F99F